MVKKILTVTMLSALFLTSCKEEKKEEVLETETVETNNEEAKTVTLTDKDGVKLDIIYSGELATLNFNGETIELTSERTASGSKYKNDQYTLTDWHGKTTLEKDGNVIFEAGEEVMPK